MIFQLLNLFPTAQIFKCFYCRRTLYVKKKLPRSSDKYEFTFDFLTRSDHSKTWLIRLVRTGIKTVETNLR